MNKKPPPPPRKSPFSCPTLANSVDDDMVNFGALLESCIYVLYSIMRE